MPEVRILSASGVCGSGFREESLRAGMAKAPHLIGCDGGSTDPGPYPLGAGTSAFPRAAIKRDLSLMLRAAREADLPLMLGSAGTAGGHPHLEMVKTLVLEIAAEHRLSFRLALIHAEQDFAARTQDPSSSPLTSCSRIARPSNGSAVPAS